MRRSFRELSGGPARGRSGGWLWFDWRQRRRRRQRLDPLTAERRPRATTRRNLAHLNAYQSRLPSLEQCSRRRRTAQAGGGPRELGGKLGGGEGERGTRQSAGKFV